VAWYGSPIPIALCVLYILRRLPPMKKIWRKPQVAEASALLSVTREPIKKVPVSLKFDAE